LRLVKTEIWLQSKPW